MPGADWVSAIATVVAAVAAVVALGVSLFALAWAKASAEAAQRANNIQLHTYRRELFIAFQQLFINFQMSNHLITKDQVIGFHEHSRTLYLYVNDSLAKDIEEFYKKCLEISNINFSLTFISSEMQKLRAQGYIDEEYKSLHEDLKEYKSKQYSLASKATMLGNPTYQALKEEIRLDKIPQTPWQRFKDLYNKRFDWGDEEEQE
ncbi:hypothetical protein [uncultured Pseudomonas sp.]|uniref:hypothetical protein n=1 Tax=uncultured Pseudomonas sp. TaxID=114707 RepID=UPI0025FA5EEC|nr:hypothetical protein [uncultured Pseudomonas sp.]